MAALRGQAVWEAITKGGGLAYVYDNAATGQRCTDDRIAEFWPGDPSAVLPCSTCEKALG